MKRLSTLAALGLTLVIVCAAAAFSASPAAARDSANACPYRVTSLVTALDTIDGELDFGVSLYDYGELIDRAIAANDRVKKRTRPSGVPQTGLPAGMARAQRPHRCIQLLGDCRTGTTTRAAQTNATGDSSPTSPVKTCGTRIPVPARQVEHRARERESCDRPRLG